MFIIDPDHNRRLNDLKSIFFMRGYLAGGVMVSAFWYAVHSWGLI